MIDLISSYELWKTEDCARAFFRESRLPGELDFNLWQKNWGGFIDRGVGEVLGAIVNDKIVGILGGFFIPCPMTGDFEAIEAFWYVLPQNRGTYGIRLIREFEKRAKVHYCKRVKMAYLNIENPVNMGTLYERLGYTELQTNVVKEL